MDEFINVRDEVIMSSLILMISSKGFYQVKFGGIRRKEPRLNIYPIGLKPGPHLKTLMRSGIIFHQKNLLEPKFMKLTSPENPDGSNCCTTPQTDRRIELPED